MAQHLPDPEKSTCVTICLRPSDRAVLRAAARERALSMSALVRQLIIDLTHREAACR
jgi:hypothetical protein